ncbi:unnamed protein product, partial [Ectocarpus sp. 12 AP-2014]
GIKSSVSVFGADQFDEDDPADVKEKQSFFNCMLWFLLFSVIFWGLFCFVLELFWVAFVGGEGSLSVFLVCTYPHFTQFYWSINLGALVSFTLVSYVCQYGLPFLGGPDWGFMAGYSIPCIAMSLALVVFLAGTPK